MTLVADWQSQSPTVGEAHEHEWGPIEHARFTGNPHRKCQGCRMVSLDLDEEE